VIRKLKNYIKIKSEYIISEYVNRPFCNQCKIFPRDVIVASYAKSGRTWPRFFVSEYLTIKYKLNLKSKNNWNTPILTPSPLCSSRGGLLSFPYKSYPKKKGRFIFSHEDYISKHFFGNQVVFITRNIYDIIISTYFYNRFRVNNNLKNINLNYYALNIFDFDKFIKLTNMFSLLLKKSAKYKIYSYEEMKKNPKKCFRDIIKFGGFKIDEAVFEEALKRTSFKNMQKNEMNDLGIRKKANLHVRKGKVYGFRDYLSESTVNTISVNLKDKLDLLLRNYYVDLPKSFNR